MRWWLLALTLLVGISVALAWLRPPARTAGMDLAEALAASPSTPAVGRGAIQLLDFTPPSPPFPDGLEAVQTGEGGLPGRSPESQPHQHWAESRAARFVWQSAVPSPLRTALSSTARTCLWNALVHMGLSADHAEQALSAALTDLEALSDHQLFDEWLRADHALLVEQADLKDAIRQGLLLAIRPERAPVLTFSIGNARIYAIALPSNARDVAALELQAYDVRGGKLLWLGTLSVTSPDPAMAPETARVRLWAARLAELATAGTSSD